MFRGPRQEALLSGAGVGRLRAPGLLLRLAAFQYMCHEQMTALRHSWPFATHEANDRQLPDCVQVAGSSLSQLRRATRVKPQRSS